MIAVTTMPTSIHHDFELEKISFNAFISNSTVPSLEMTDKRQNESTETPMTTEEQSTSTGFSLSEGETTPSIIDMAEVRSDVTTEISMTEGTTVSTADVTNEVISSMSTESLMEESQEKSQVNVSTDAPQMPEEDEPLFLIKTESPAMDEGTTVSPDVTTEIIVPTETTGTEVYSTEKNVNDKVQSQVTEPSETLTTTEKDSRPLGVSTESPVTETQTSSTSDDEIERIQVRLSGDLVLNDGSEVESTVAPAEIFMTTEKTESTTEIAEELSSDSTTMSSTLIEQQKLNETLSVSDGNLIIKNNQSLFTHEVTEGVLNMANEEQAAITISFVGGEEILSTTLSAERILESTDNYVVDDQGVISTSGVILNNFK